MKATSLIESNETLALKAELRKGKEKMAGAREILGVSTIVEIDCKEGELHMFAVVDGMIYRKFITSEGVNNWGVEKSFHALQKGFEEALKRKDNHDRR